MRRIVALASIMAVSLLAAVGCEENKMSMEQMMAPAPRPAELDRLNAFMGSWKSESEIVMAGADETMTGEGENVVEWTVDNRYMVEHFNYTAGGESGEGVAYWTWDEAADKYRGWWFESDGSVGTGTMDYDDDEGVWEMKSKSQNMSTGQKMVGEGTIEFVDADTMKWDFTAWDSLHLTKIIEFHGTGHRQ